VQSFAYVLANTIDEAVTLLSQDGDLARVLSGGTDLLIQLKEGRCQAKLVVDVKKIPQLNELSYDPQTGLLLGAAVPCYRIYRNPLICAIYPGLVDAACLIGGIQIQGRASLGGNLCNASPAADSIPALMVHSAACVIAGPAGLRELPVDQFCTGPGRTVLQRGELLVAVKLPPPPPRFGARYLRFIPRNEMDIAVTGVGASVLLDESGTKFLSARIALGAVAPTPLLVPAAGAALAGQPISTAIIAEAARIAQDATSPIDDMRGTAAQRKHLSGILTRRALEKAVERARAS